MASPALSMSPDSYGRSLPGSSPPPQTLSSADNPLYGGDSRTSWPSGSESGSGSVQHITTPYPHTSRFSYTSSAGGSFNDSTNSSVDAFAELPSPSSSSLNRRDIRTHHSSSVLDSSSKSVQRSQPIAVPTGAASMRRRAPIPTPDSPNDGGHFDGGKKTFDDIFSNPESETNIKIQGLRVGTIIPSYVRGVPPALALNTIPFHHLLMPDIYLPEPLRAALHQQQQNYIAQWGRGICHRSPESPDDCHYMDELVKSVTSPHRWPEFLMRLGMQLQQDWPDPDLIRGPLTNSLSAFSYGRVFPPALPRVKAEKKKLSSHYLLPNSITWHQSTALEQIGLFASAELCSGPDLISAQRIYKTRGKVMLMAIEKIVSEAQPRDGLGATDMRSLAYSPILLGYIPSSILAKITTHTGIINSHWDTNFEQGRHMSVLMMAKLEREGLLNAKSITTLNKYGLNKRLFAESNYTALPPQFMRATSHDNRHIDVMIHRYPETMLCNCRETLHRLLMNGHFSIALSDLANSTRRTDYEKQMACKRMDLQIKNDAKSTLQTAAGYIMRVEKEVLDSAMKGAFKVRTHLLHNSSQPDVDSVEWFSEQHTSDKRTESDTAKKAMHMRVKQCIAAGITVYGLRSNKDDSNLVHFNQRLGTKEGVTAASFPGCSVHRLNHAKFDKQHNQLFEFSGFLIDKHVDETNGYSMVAQALGFPVSNHKHVNRSISDPQHSLNPPSQPVILKKSRRK